MHHKVIIVTGASRGLGLAVAQCLLKEQPDVRLIAVARGKEALSQLAAQSDRVATMAADLRNTNTGAHVVDFALSKFGRLDGIVINHGTMDPISRLSEADLDAWRTAFDVNILSGISLIKSAIPHLRSSGGRIILVSSGAAVRGYAAWGCYGMTKAALNHLALTLANEERDVTTLSIRPGMVDTEMQVALRTVHNKTMNKDEADKFIEAKESGKLLRPDQPGNVIARLSIKATKDLSGSFLSWDDGERLSKYQDGGS